MTKAINRLPAILLAVIIAAALSFTAWGALQPACAADNDKALEPIVTTWNSGYGYGVPGQTIQLEAEVQNVDPDVLAQATIEWKMSGESAGDYATIEQDPSDPFKATLTFGELKEKPMFSYYAVLHLGAAEYQSDHSQLILTSEYTVAAYDWDFERTVCNLAPDQSATMHMQVLHFDTDHLNGEPVKATYDWTYNENDVKIEGSDGNFTVTRLSTDETEFLLGIDWGTGNDVSYYFFGEMSYNLNDYFVFTSLPSERFMTIIPEGTTMSKEDLAPRVVYGYNEYGAPLPEDVYDLKVEKYLGYDEETGDDVYSTNPADNCFPLKVNEKGALDLNDNEVGGFAMYKLTATAKKAPYTGETYGYVLLYSDHTLNYWASTLDFGVTPKFVENWPYVQYEISKADVDKGKKLEPKAIYIGEADQKTFLTPGENCEIVYVNAVGEESTTYPTEMGVYEVVVRGTNGYYGSNEGDFNYLKIADKNPVSVKGKTLKVKKNKKKSFSAKKAFSVKKAKGKLVYTKVSGNKKITVSKTGKVTVKKLKKGTYKVKVKVHTDGDSTHLSADKTATITVKVK